MIDQAILVEKLDAFFRVAEFDESKDRESFPPGYESIFRRFAAPAFLDGSLNGLMLDNTSAIDRVYCAVFPSEAVLDTIIAREVERKSSGALIFCHHLTDYQESGPGAVHITEAQLETLREHKISYYACHAPLDCHPEISTSTALATALKLSDRSRFAEYYGGQSGVYGKVGPLAFHEFARRASEACGLPTLRYDSLRHNGLPVNQVAVITGLGGTPRHIREALSLGCDTFVTGEWWLFGPGEWRMRHRERMRDLLRSGEADINLIGTSHYASEMLVMRDFMPGWVRANAPGAEPVFVGQDDPWR